MSIDLDSMTDGELSGLIEDAKDLLAKRQSVAALDQQIGRLLQDARDSGVIPSRGKGAEWAQPEGAHDAYLEGDVVSHEGELRVSTFAGANVWPPSDDRFWADAPDDYEPEPQPEAEEWRPGEDVATGDLRSFEGTVYEVIQPHTTQEGWEPPSAHALWRIA